MKFLSRYRFSIAALILGGLLTVLALFTQLDVIRTGISALQHVEDRNVDDLLVAFLLVVAGIVTDMIRGQRRLQIEAHRLETLRATMRTVEDLVGNALNNLLLFRMEAEDHVSAEALQQFDEIIQQTSSRLKLLANVDAVVEKTMAAGTGIEYEGNSV